MPSFEKSIAVLMKPIIFFFILVISTQFVVAQYEYEPNKNYPFGRYNPEAPKELQDFQPMIGECKCTSIARNKDQSWGQPQDMIWRWKYIMNGKGVQDETLKADGGNSGSIRQYDKDSMRWNVHYYSSAGITQTLSTWHGNKKEDKIVLYRPQQAPNGMEGSYRLTFYDISENGYKWIGEWVDTTEKIVYPTWKIECTRED